MYNWHPKPGDSVFRPRRIRRSHLRRVLGVPALFSAGYGNVGSSIYYALGIVALIMMIVTVLVIFAGISIVSLSAMTPQELASEWARDPVAGIAANLPIAVLSTILKPLIAILAATILLIATNAGLMGISRLAFSLGNHRLVPPVLSRVHPKFKTPYISIILFSIIALFILSPGFFASDVFKNMGALYVFGSLLAFIFAHASIIGLRVRKPELERPFKLGWNIKIRRREIPISALVGLVATATIWVIILIVQPYSLWVGLVWMTLGLIIYYIYRRKWRKKESS